VTRRIAAAAMVRLLAVERCCIGAALLGRPNVVSRRVSDGESLPPAWLVRILGARMLAQGLLEFVRPRRRLVLVGAAVDIAHAVSMIVPVVLLPAQRRTAAASAAEASLSAVAAVALAPGLSA
jgi:hypothetical protein